MIAVANYISNAFSDADAAALTPIIERDLDEFGKAVLDFTNIRFFTTLFFNNSISKYVLQYGPEEFKKRIQLKGLSAIGMDTFYHSFENACNLFAMSEDKRKQVIEIESNLDNLCEDD